MHIAGWQVTTEAGLFFFSFSWLLLLRRTGISKCCCSQLLSLSMLRHALLSGHTHDAACGDSQLTNPIALCLQLKTF